MNIPLNTPEGRRIREALRPRKPMNPFLVLTHAIWHCEWGSGHVDREPDRGDKDAALILRRLRKLVLDGIEEEMR